MCGICGIVDFTATSVDEGMIRVMTRTLKHRGPDDQGIAVSGAMGFGHTRLSIIDLTAAGRQPMQSADGQVTLVYNGEVYNFVALRREMERDGHVFLGRSDAEVVLHAYLRWGADAFRRFNGMFALAIWDARTETLYLARDRFGIKPLYYYRLPSGIVFGSEIKALLASGCVPRRLHVAGLHEYLYYGAALESNTLFEGIAKVLPASFMTVNKSGVRSTPYWQIEEVEQVRVSPKEAAATIRERLEQAVRAQLVSDVPVGVFLSGGIDSSAITALASKHYQGRLQTFSVGFDYDQGVNELSKARQVAQQYGTEHHELHIQGYRLQHVIEHLVSCHDEPFGDAANIPLYLLCRELSGNPKVILQGDGGDEIFAGYRRYNVLSFYLAWRAILPLVRRMLACIRWHSSYYRGARFLSAVGMSDTGMLMASLLTTEMRGTPLRILNPSLQQRLGETGPYAEYLQWDRRLDHLDIVQRMLYTDTRILLPNIFLEKVDKATMAHGIEVRVPMLDYTLVDYVLGLPANLKVRWGQKKWILRRALRGTVSDEILDAPKTGFSVPYEYWLRKPLADYLRSILLDGAVAESRLFEPQQLRRCLMEHTSGQQDHGFLLWKALHLALWFDTYDVSF